MSGLHLLPGGGDDTPVGGRAPDGGPPDDRLTNLLRDALAPAAAAPVPVDLVPNTLGAVRGSRQARPMFRLAGLSAAAAVLVAGVALTIVTMHGTANPVGPGISGTPSAAPSAHPSAIASGEQSAALGPDGFPTTVSGLPVLTVSEARAALDPSKGPAVVAVKGYLSVANLTGLRCPFQPDSRLIPGCGALRYLMENPEQVVVSGGQFSGPSGPSLDPVFPWPGQVPVEIPTFGSAGALSRPLTAVLVGHVDDPLWATCASTSCAGLFVVDTVAWLDGAPAPAYDGSDVGAEAAGPASSPTTAVTTSTRDMIGTAITSRVPGFHELAAIPIRVDRLPSYDPRIPSPSGNTVVTWLVRSWEADPSGTPTLTTYLVPDASIANVYGVTDAGVAAVPAADTTFPTTVAGLPVISVSEALAARDEPSRTSPESLAVRGWFTEWGPLPCPSTGPRPGVSLAPTSPLLAWDCSVAMDTLTERAERLITADGGHGASTDNPSLHPRFVRGRREFDARLGTTNQPIAVVMVGHFHDVLAQSCDPSIRTNCEQVFVVDSVAWVGPTADAGQLSPETPTTVAGHPVIAVAEAVAIRDDPARTTPDTLAVLGWFQAAPAVPCPAPASHPPELAPACPDDMAALMASPETLQYTNPDGSGGWRPPTGPSITPRFLAAYPSDLPKLGSSSGPVQAVLVGHFHDAAASKCAASDRTTCGQQFVVESVGWVATAASTPASDSRLTCRDGFCPQAAAVVATADPDAYASAGRIAQLSMCPPWLQCPRLPSQSATIALVPSNWRGDPADLHVWSVSADATSQFTTTRAAGTLNDYDLSLAGGYTVTCNVLVAADCYAHAAAIARADMRQDGAPITSITLTDQCGSGFLRRSDGTETDWWADCALPTASPSPSASASAAFPDTVLGMAVIDVAEAIHERDAASWAGASLVAVKGWFAPAPMLSCPMAVGASDLERGCPDGWAWLMEQPEHLVTTSPDSMSGRGPTGAALNPRFVGAAVSPPLRTTNGQLDFTPLPVVLVGHFGDGRAAYCQDTNADTCANALVVDGGAWMDGRTIDPVADGQAQVDPQLGLPPAADVAAIVGAAYPAAKGWTITSMSGASSFELARLDPRTVAMPDLDRSRNAWIVGLVRFGGSPPVTPDTRTVLTLPGSTTTLRLPDWPTRIDAANRPATVKQSGLTCQGLTKADCVAAAARVRDAIPSARSAAARLVIVPGCPPWARWPAAAGLDGVRIAAIADDTSGLYATYLLLRTGQPVQVQGANTLSWPQLANEVSQTP